MPLNQIDRARAAVAGARRRACLAELAKAVAVVGPAAFLVSCMTLEQIAPPVDATMQEAAQGERVTLAVLDHGRMVYLTQCTTCHAAEPVEAYTRAQWDKIMPEMIEETSLTAEQARAVTAYVRAVLAMTGSRPAAP